MSNQIYSNIYELEILAKAAYKYNRDLPDGWIMVDSVSNKQTGFYGKVFLSVKNSEVVISFSGTDLFPPNKDRSLGEKFDDLKSAVFDLYNDINMAIKNVPSQLQNAKMLYKDVKSKFPNVKITLTGESLGGSLAALCGAETGERTYTFRAFGMAEVLPDKNKKYDNITNIGETYDSIFMANINQHIGKTLIIPDKNGKIFDPPFRSGINFHRNGIMCFADAVEYKKGTVVSLMEKLADEENYNSPDLEDKRNAIKTAIYFYEKRDNIRTEALQNQDKNLLRSFWGTAKDVVKKVKHKLRQGYDNLVKGHWVTIDGNHVFIEE